MAITKVCRSICKVKLSIVFVRSKLKIESRKIGASDKERVRHDFLYNNILYGSVRRKPRTSSP